MTRSIFAAATVFVAASATFVTAPASAQVRNELMLNAERMLAESGRPRCVINDPQGGGLAEVPCADIGGRGYNAGYPGYNAGYGYQQPAPQQMSCTSVLVIFSTCRAGPREERSGRTRRTRDGEDQQFCGRHVGWVPSGRPCDDYLIAALERSGSMHLLPELRRPLP